MPKRAFSVAFKKEVIEYCEGGKQTAYAAAQHFGERDGCQYDVGNFYQWLRNKEIIKGANSERMRASGGGRKSLLGGLEESLKQEIIDLRLQKQKITREWIGQRARQIATENGFNLKASTHWISNFMDRHNLSLQRITKMTLKSWKRFHIMKNCSMISNST